jgi:hypothetical protein
MGSFPFDREFLPVVKSDDYINFLPKGPGIEAKTFKVNQSEPIQPFLIDALQIANALPPSITTLAANGTANDRTNFLGPEAIRRLLEVDKNAFCQYRVEPMDDILIQLGAPGAQSPLWSTVNATTTISKRLPVSRASTRLTAVQSTDALLWANTKNGDIAGLIAGQSPSRRARIVGLHISIVAAAATTHVTFGDAAVSGGTAASLASAQLDFAFAASAITTLNLGRDSLPEDLFLNSGIVVQQDQANTTRITIVVEEDNGDIFGKRLLFEELADANHSHEFYAYQNQVPSLKVINPQNVSQSTARMIFAGWLFDIESKEPPSGVKPIGIPLLRLPRLGSSG